MSCLFAIDCSTDECSLAIWRDGAVVGHRTYPARQASDQIVSRIDELLASCSLGRHDLSAIAVGIGPGAFTGVRLVVATAQGLALAFGIPIHPVSTLAAVAWAARRNSSADMLPILALLDARMEEVYAGWFQPEVSGIAAIAPEIVIDPAQLIRPSQVSRFLVAGTGYAPYREQLDSAIGRPVAIASTAPIALAVAELAARQPASAGSEPDRIEPAYIRHKVALTSREQQALRGSG